MRSLQTRAEIRAERVVGAKKYQQCLARMSVGSRVTSAVKSTIYQLKNFANSKNCFRLLKDYN